MPRIPNALICACHMLVAPPRYLRPRWNEPGWPYASAQKTAETNSLLSPLFEVLACASLPRVFNGTRSRRAPARGRCRDVLAIPRGILKGSKSVDFEPFPPRYSSEDRQDVTTSSPSRGARSAACSVKTSGQGMHKARTSKRWRQQRCQSQRFCALAIGPFPVHFPSWT